MGMTELNDVLAALAAAKWVQQHGCLWMHACGDAKSGLLTQGTSSSKLNYAGLYVNRYRPAAGKVAQMLNDANILGRCQTGGFWLRTALWASGQAACRMYEHMHASPADCMAGMVRDYSMHGEQRA